MAETAGMATQVPEQAQETMKRGRGLELGTHWWWRTQHISALPCETLWTALHLCPISLESSPRLTRPHCIGTPCPAAPSSWRPLFPLCSHCLCSGHTGLLAVPQSPSSLLPHSDLAGAVFSPWNIPLPISVWLPSPASRVSAQMISHHYDHPPQTSMYPPYPDLLHPLFPYPALWSSRALNNMLFIFLFFFLAIARGLRDLSSLTRD